MAAMSFSTISAITLVNLASPLKTRPPLYDATKQNAQGKPNACRSLIFPFTTSILISLLLCYTSSPYFKTNFLLYVDLRLCDSWSYDYNLGYYILTNHWRCDILACGPIIFNLAVIFLPSWSTHATTAFILLAVMHFEKMLTASGIFFLLCQWSKAVQHMRQIPILLLGKLMMIISYPMTIHPLHPVSSPSWCLLRVSSDA